MLCPIQTMPSAKGGWCPCADAAPSSNGITVKGMDRPPPKIARRFTASAETVGSMSCADICWIKAVFSNGMRQRTREKGFSDHENVFAPGLGMLFGFVLLRFGLGTVCVSV